MNLLAREEFRNKAIERDGKCVICNSIEDLAVHHILDRSLFPDGGYYLENAATLCPNCHIAAEKGSISCQTLRNQCNIKEIALPANLDSSKEWDKWGREIKTSEKLFKYPRTAHIEGSGIQKGDDDSTIVQFNTIVGKYLVCEEKIDGANTGVSFNSEGSLQLQCRGHYLVGHNDWPEFNLFKAWGTTWQDQLFDILSDRYIMYGEWMLAFHSVFYDLLPHYFMEFDIYDKQEGVFLSTGRRQEIIARAEVPISSVRVLTARSFETREDLLSLVGRSAFVSDNALEIVEREMKEKRFPEDVQATLLKLNDKIMEGLYIKREADGIVKGRYKYVRPNFVQTILASDVHWSERPTIPNKLREGCDIFALKENK